MSARPLSITFLGLSITSSWGNGHATCYRGLAKWLHRRGHVVLFLERDVPWYAANRDLPSPPYGETRLYGSVEELAGRHADRILGSDLVVLGSYVPDGAEIGSWLADEVNGGLAFFDIDTPVTLAKLAAGDHQYLSPELVPRFDLYLSFSGGPVLERLEEEWGARRARLFPCSFDPESYYPEPSDHGPRWDLAYMGTYGEDRQPALERLLLEPARRLPEGRFAVAGPGYPASVEWPENIERIEHLPPGEHRAFYNAQRFTVNVTRADMVEAGWSPSVRLFEAAACGTPIISDRWPGLEDFLVPGEEVFVAESAEDAVRIVSETSEEERLAVAERALARVRREHSACHRAAQLEAYVLEVLGRIPRLALASAV
jgi:spore maturation protein CgeB